MNQTVPLSALVPLRVKLWAIVGTLILLGVVGMIGVALLVEWVWRHV